MDYDKIITNELEKLRKNISSNISKNGQKASGRTQKSMEVVKNGDKYSLLGRRGFYGMERGNPPRNIRGFYYIIKQWAVDKGIFSKGDKGLNTFAYFVSEKIKKNGTKLYREGGRRDVFTNEFPKTIKNISDEIGNALDLQFKKD